MSNIDIKNNSITTKEIEFNSFKYKLDLLDMPYFDKYPGIVVWRDSNGLLNYMSKWNPHPSGAIYKQIGIVKPNPFRNELIVANFDLLNENFILAMRVDENNIKRDCYSIILGRTGEDILREKRINTVSTVFNHGEEYCLANCNRYAKKSYLLNKYGVMQKICGSNLMMLKLNGKLTIYDALIPDKPLYIVDETDSSFKIKEVV